METRACGRSGLVLPALGLGCWAFGGGDYWGTQDQAEVDRVVHAATDLGVNYFDTAEAYNDGRSEESLGRALSGVPRDRVIIGTKVSPAAVQPATLPSRLETSLRRLRTDHVDLYMVHWPITPHSIRHFTPDPVLCPSVDDAFATLDKLCDQGKVRHVGVSNFGVNKIKEALVGGAKLAVNELPYNLLARAIEYEALPFCAAMGIGVIGYFALMQGLLAGIWPSLDQVPAAQRRTRHFDSRGSREARHGERGAEAETASAIASVSAIGRELGLTPPEVAIRWCVSNPLISCTLAGARTVAELEANARAAAEPLPAGAMDRLNLATRPLLVRLGASFDYYENAANDRTV